MKVDYELSVFLLTRWATCCCYWRLPLVAPLSGSLLSSYKKDTWWILVGHFWNAFQSDNKNHSARKPFLTKLVNDIFLLKWRLNQDQTNNRFNLLVWGGCSIHLPLCKLDSRHPWVFLIHYLLEMISHMSDFSLAATAAWLFGKISRLANSSTCYRVTLFKFCINPVRVRP